MVTIHPIKLAQIGPLLRSLRVQHPLVKEVFETCDLLRGQKQNSEPDQEQSCGTLFAPSFAGKSTAVNMYMETRVVDDCYERKLFSRKIARATVLKVQRLVIRIVLPTNAHMGSLIYALLKALGDRTPGSGTIDERRDRAYILMKALGVELLIIDEIDHLRVPPSRHSANREAATSAHNQLKMFMQDGWPVLFVGIPEARSKLFTEDQVKNREMYDISYKALDMGDTKDIKVYREFCANFGIGLYEKGITTEVFPFVKKEIYFPLAKASECLFGVTAKLTQTALEYAYRAGRVTLTREDLIAAADRHSLVDNPRDNPFRVYDRVREAAELEAAS